MLFLGHHTIASCKAKAKVNKSIRYYPSFSQLETRILYCELISLKANKQSRDDGMIKCTSYILNVNC